MTNEKWIKTTANARELFVDKFYNYKNTKQKNFLLLKSVLGVLLTFLVLVSWSSASPIGSAADDNYHLPSIWCGSFSEQCQTTNGKFLVPSETLTGMCYIIWIDRDIKRYNENASCTVNDSSNFQETDFINQSTELYPNLFYDVSSIFVGDSVESSVLRIRLFWSSLFLFLVSVIYFTGRKAIKSGLLSMIAILGVPLIVFLVASTNPSSLQITTIGLLPFALTGLFDENTTSRNKKVLFWVSIVLVFGGVSSKPESFIYVGLIILATILFNHKSSKKLTYSVPLVFVFALSIYIFDVINMLQKVEKNITNTAIPLLPLQWELLSHNISNFHQFLAGFWGFYWGLGWKFEPPLNDTLAYFQFLLWLSILILGYRRIIGRSRKTIIAILVFFLISIPISTLQKGYFKVGDIVQPRYMLPFGVAVTGVILISVISSSTLKTKNFDTKVIEALIKVAAILSFAAGTNTIWIMLVRNVNGLDHRTLDLGPNSWWWEHAIISPTWIFILQTVSLLCVLLVFLRRPLTFEGIESKSGERK
jgi:hypothetical protein